MKPLRLTTSALLGCLALSSFALPSAAVAQSSGPATAPDVVIPGRGGWETYVNRRFGTRLSYPADVFGEGEPSQDGDGRRFSSGDAQLEVFGWENSDGETARSLQNRLVGTEGYEDVTYARSGSGWLVLSGFRGDNIFYEKYFFSGDTIQAFGIEFPTDRKPFYAPIVERIEDSFRAG